MKVSELIKKLESVAENLGDCDVEISNGNGCFGDEIAIVKINAESGAFLELRPKTFLQIVEGEEEEV